MSPQPHSNGDIGPTDSDPLSAADEVGEPAGWVRRGWWWRVSTPLVFLLAGALFVVSALDSGGEDLRPGGYGDLGSLVRAERDDATRLTNEAAQLGAQVQQLSSQMRDTKVAEAQRVANRLRPASGLSRVVGPGVTVVLTDAPTAVITEAVGDRNAMVVHQQDIQAVVNAMWRGGADAITLQGQRLITTTGIKCTGNTVQVHGVPYPPPYVIAAVGDQVDIAAAIEADPYLQLYRQAAANPAIAVGWSIVYEPELVAPAYDGVLELSYARPLKVSKD